MEAIGCADQKATKLLNELESKAGLIERKRQGLGKPNLIYVKNFVDTSALNEATAAPNTAAVMDAVGATVEKTMRMAKK